jgi:hypothetical protein
MAESLPVWDPNLRKRTKGYGSFFVQLTFGLNFRFVHKQEKYEENVETLKCVMPHLFRESYGMCH